MFGQVSFLPVCGSQWPVFSHHLGAGGTLGLYHSRPVGLSSMPEYCSVELEHLYLGLESSTIIIYTIDLRNYSHTHIVHVLITDQMCWFYYIIPS